MKRTNDSPRGMTTFTPDNLGSESLPVTDILVSSVRVATRQLHDRVTVFNRGAISGELIVDKGDGERIAERLLDYPQARSES